MMLGSGHPDLGADEGYGGAVAGVQPRVFDVPGCSPVAACTETGRSGGNDELRAARVRQYLVNVAIDGDGWMPAGTAVGRAGNAADVHVGEQRAIRSRR